MLHKMNLWNDSFQKIRNRTKTIEMRLNDEKRQMIKVGDLIEFVNVNDREVIQAEVINLHYYKNFRNLYKHHSNIAIGYDENEQSNYNDMYNYYTKTDIDHYGVVGIEIKII